MSIRPTTILLVLALTACAAPVPGPRDLPGTPTVNQPTQAPLPTRTVAAHKTVAADGSLALSTPALQLSFDVTARVTKVNVAAGQAVKQGDVLAEVDDSGLKDALQQSKDQLALSEAQVVQQQAPAKQTDINSAKASLASAQARYTELKRGSTQSEIEQALRNWNEGKNSLYQSQLQRDTECGWTAGMPANQKASPNTPDCKSAQYNVASSELNERIAYQKYLDAQKPPTKERLAQAWADVVSARASLAKTQAGTTSEQKQVADVQLEQVRLTVSRAERDLAKSKLVSPCNCIVQDVTVVPGAASAPGTTAVTLLKLDDIRFRTSNLTERDVTNIKTGNTATLRLRAFTEPFTGTVRAVLPLSTSTQGGNAVFTVVVALDPGDKTLLPGMCGQGEIRIEN